MSHFEILRELFKQSMIVPVTKNIHDPLRMEVELHEANLYSVVLVGLPPESDIVVLKSDNFPALSEVFNGTRGECKRADFVIFANTGGKNIIMFLELKSKSKNESEQHIIKQLKGAQCVVEYCKGAGKIFWDKEFLDDFELRFVCLRNININKRPTRNTTATLIHNTPEHMLKINCPRRLEFNKLVGKP